MNAVPDFGQIYRNEDVISIRVSQPRPRSFYPEFGPDFDRCIPRGRLHEQRVTPQVSGEST